MDILVNIDVDDLGRAVAFYADGLGLRLARRLFGGTVAEMTGASVRVQLLQKPAGSPSGPQGGDVRRYARHWTPVHLDFVVADIDAAVRRAVAAGARLESRSDGERWGRLATLSDPFGHGFCLIAFSPEGYAAAT